MMNSGSASSQASALERLNGKVAVITGGASGIGESTVRLFVKYGAKVVIADIQDDLGLSVCADINSEDAVSYVHCDVTKESDVQNAVDTAIAKHGKLDIMFSNAGMVGRTDPSILGTDYEDFRRVFDVNVFGGFLCAKHAARVMIPVKKGSIIFTASSLSVISSDLVAHEYVASKHAVVGLTKNLCVELGQHGIRVNCISPFTVVTPTGMKGMGMNKEQFEAFFPKFGNLKEAILEANDIAQAAVYLGSDESKYLSGVNLVIDGGYSATNTAFKEQIKKMRS